MNISAPFSFKLKSRILGIIAVLVITCSGTFAQNLASEKITYQNEDLRSLARKYFNDANLWEAILKVNNLSSPIELKAGMQIIIPTGLVNTTIANIDESNKTIQKCSENGAKVFTPELLNSATTKLNDAIKEKDNNNWQQAYVIISESLRDAKESLEQSQLLRNQSADATLSFVKGDVQNRRPADRLWNNASLFSKLFEEDRTRTLTESFAEITFVDLSRVRLNENSQALIQRSRVDLLQNKTETTVRLIKGDAFAYLLKSPKKKFDIDVPGLDTKIMSKSFWIEKQETNTKIANYEGEIELEAEGTKVIVKENQGSIIPEGGPPSEPQDLLPSPILQGPANAAQIFTGNVKFEWASVNGAVQYWFEIAKDQSFKELVYSSKFIRTTEYSVASLAPGLYFWHIASIDNSGFPGYFSDYKFVNMIVDESKPYLQISEPSKFTITKNKSLTVKGETEPSAMISINNKLVPVDESGLFSEVIQLEDGYNNLTIVSEDKALNKTIYKYEAVYEADSDIRMDILSDNYNDADKSIISNSFPISVRGKTRPLSEIELLLMKSNSEMRTYADTNGYFQYQLNDVDNDERILQSITTPAAFIRTDSISIIIDKIPPALNITSVIPRSVSSSDLLITGTVKDADKLIINNSPVQISEGKFEYNAKLNSGNNSISIIAKDNAGNTTVETRSVLLDTLPPELISHNIILAQSDKKLVTIRVVASDASGMKKIANSTITLGGTEMNKILKLRDDGKTYELQFTLEDSGQEVKLISVKLEDYLNNSKVYGIKN